MRFKFKLLAGKKWNLGTLGTWKKEIEKTRDSRDAGDAKKGDDWKEKLESKREKFKKVPVFFLICLIHPFSFLSVPSVPRLSGLLCFLLSLFSTSPASLESNTFPPQFEFGSQTSLSLFSTSPASLDYSLKARDARDAEKRDAMKEWNQKKGGKIQDSNSNNWRESFGF